ncbi:MAG: type VI secretion system tip protein TssI/VgrG [Polyangiaceae bacterium]
MAARTREWAGVDRYTVVSGALPPHAAVAAFRSIEALSAPYRVELAVVVSGDHALDLSACLGERMTLRLDAGADGATLTGLVREASLVEATGSGATARRVYSFAVAPRLGALALGQRSRVFTRTRFPDILLQVLRESGIEGDAVELRLTRDYPTEEHVCQYRESDLAFLSRWIEREGIYYFFEHDAGGERAVFVDDRSAHEGSATRAPIRFRASASEARAPEGFHAARTELQSLPTRVVVTDHDYQRPGLSLVGSARARHRGHGDVSLYGARAFTPAEAAHVARVRAEALFAEARQVEFEGSERRVQPGFLFDLDESSGAERSDLLGAWLALEVEREAAPIAGVGAIAWPSRARSGVSGAYRARVRALAASVQHRTPHRTPWPRIAGFESATVDGPADSSYAQIDAHGRYAIRLHFDEARAAGASSTWVRMAQPHGGGAEGMHFPLRRGTEVLVHFQDGDPDRPVIGGVLPNADTPSPVTAMNATRNVLQTGGATRLEIEDAEGAQYMNTTTPVMGSGLFMGDSGASPKGHHVELATEGSGAKSFGAHFDRFIGGPKSEQVSGPVTRAYDAPYVTSVAGNATRDYAASHARVVKGDSLLVVGGTLDDTVMGAAKESFGASLDETVTGAVSATYATDHALAIGGPQLVSVSGAAEGRYTSGLGVRVEGAMSRHDVHGDLKLDAGGDIVVKATSALSGRGGAVAGLSSPATTLRGDTSVSLEAGVAAGVTAPEIGLSGSASISFSAPAILIKGGDVMVRGGTVSLHGAEVHLTSQGRAVASASATCTVNGGPSIDVKGDTILLNVSGSPESLGTAVAARLALNPDLSASLTGLEQAGWTIAWGPPGSGSYFDRARKVIVLDPSLRSDPEAATRELERLAAEVEDPDHTLHGQEEPMSCVIASAQMMIHTDTGQDLDEAGLRAESSAMPGGYDPINGTYFSSVEALLDAHGVDAHAFGPTSLDDLARATADGSPAMLAIVNGDGSGHAVVCDGYTTNPDGTRTFHIRDPWPPNQGATYDVHESAMGSDFYGDGSGASYGGSAVTTTGGAP